MHTLQWGNMYIEWYALFLVNKYLLLSPYSKSLKVLFFENILFTSQQKCYFCPNYQAATILIFYKVVHLGLCIHQTFAPSVLTHAQSFVVQFVDCDKSG